MELVSREMGCTMHDLKQWRDKCVLGGKDIGWSIATRHDWGPQYIAIDFKTELKFSGLKNSPALVSV